MDCCVSQRLAQKEKITIKQQQEQEIIEKVKIEREYLRDKQGIERYFIPDPNNPIDQKIVRWFKSNASDPMKEERKCKVILAKRLNTGLSKDSKNIKLDTIIESRIETRCKMHNKMRNEVVREAFCTHFNIKE